MKKLGVYKDSGFQTGPESLDTTNADKNITQRLNAVLNVVP